MEIHSRQSFYENRGISIQPRQRQRSRIIAAPFFAFMIALFRRIRNGIEFEGKARRAVEELSAMDDRMLRDVGICRCDIERVIYHQESSVVLTDVSVCS